LADEHGDYVTNDLATERVTTHDKFAWMLRVMLRDMPENNAG
ncbi:MAG: ferritin-like domain-containing protein, partial [Pseudomonadota bacterium]